MNYRLASIIAAFCAAFMVNGCGGGGGEVTSAIPTVPISSAPYELTSSTPANGAVNVDPVNTKEVVVNYSTKGLPPLFPSLICGNEGFTGFQFLSTMSLSGTNQATISINAPLPAFTKCSMGLIFEATDVRRQGIAVLFTTSDDPAPTASYDKTISIATLMPVPLFWQDDGTGSASSKNATGYLNFSNCEIATRSLSTGFILLNCAITNDNRTFSSDKFVFKLDPATQRVSKYLDAVPPDVVFTNDGVKRRYSFTRP